MSRSPAPDTEELLARACSGDRSARGALLDRHRARLARMVAFHLDRRLAARVDPSDVVQEALTEAAGRLSDYLVSRPLPFYPWLPASRRYAKRPGSGFGLAFSRSTRITTWLMSQTFDPSGC